MLTFSQVKIAVAPYAGTGGSCNNEVISVFARTVLEYLLYKADPNSLRRFDLLAVKGCFAAPEELEVPVKVKINGYSGAIWSKHFSFSQQASLDGCLDVGNILKDNGNYTPIAYPLPVNGSVIGVMGTVPEAMNSDICVMGFDPTGREIYTSYKGQTTKGEYLTIREDTISYGSAVFGQIVSVVKPKTNGYVSLWAVDPNTKARQFLSDYSPWSENPQFKQFTISGINCSPVAEVTILGKIRLKEKYADNDLVPFESLVPIIFAAQKLYSETTFNIENAQHKEAVLDRAITDEANYKKPGQQGIDVLKVTSPGRIRNIVPSTSGFRWRNWGARG
jgi:hypothetical protein